MRIARLLHLSIAICCAQIAVAFATGFGPQLHKPSNAGQEFYFTFLPCYEESGNNKTLMYITSTENGSATISIAGKKYSQNLTLKANTCVPVEIEPSLSQVFSKPINGTFPPELVYSGAAIHISSTVPCVVYGVTRFAYTCDTFLVLPVESLGNSYVCASYPDMSWMYAGYSLPSEVEIVATQDNTQVSFTLGGPALTKTSGGLIPGQTLQFVMNAGDVWAVGNDYKSKSGDLTGSRIMTDKPVAVFGGNQCANVPVATPWCDFIDEQLTPIEQWGYHYLIPKFKLRTRGYYERVFASIPNCELLRNGSPWKTLPTVGGDVNRGWTDERVDSANQATSISSTSPISVTVYNPGQADDSVSTDPFQMNVLPWEQFTTSCVLCTPGLRGGINFTRNYIGLVFPVNDDSSFPADLEFGVSVKGIFKWQSVASRFGEAYSAKDVYSERMPNGSRYVYKECKLDSDGVYSFRSSKPFMVYAYGGSDYDSYGHPAGAIALDLQHPNDHQAPVTTMTETSNVFICNTIDLPNDANIRSNVAKIVLDESSTNFSLSVPPFNPMSAAPVDWSMQVVDYTKEALGLVVIVDRAGNDTTISVHYVPGTLSTASKPNITCTTGGTACVGDSVVLTCYNSDDFQSIKWSTGETVRSIVVSSDIAQAKFITLRGISKTSSTDTSVTAIYTVIFNERPIKPVVLRQVDTLTTTSFGVFYQWYRHGTPIAGATTNLLNVSGYGADTVRVLVTNYSGCSTLSDPVYVHITVGISDNFDFSFLELQPNPASNLSVLKYAEYPPKSIDVYDVRGVLIQHYQGSEIPYASLELPLEALSAGVYCVQVHYDHVVRTLRLIKE